MNADKRRSAFIRENPRLKLPFNRKCVIVSTALCISDPHDRREVVLASWLLLDEDLAATSLFSQSNSDAPIRERVKEVRLPVVIRRAANRLDVGRTAANSDPHVIVNAATPRHAPAAIAGVGIVAATAAAAIELALDVG